MKSTKPQFCPPCRKLLFDGANVSPVLPFSLTDIPRELDRGPTENIKRISISGVQFKISLLLTAGKLGISGVRGPLEFILKPPPRSFDIKHPEAVPANEHLTMQLARQVFGLKTAANAYLSFESGATAYLTRRFDVTPTERLQQEDFAQIDSRSRTTHGENFKYETSHEHIANLIRRFVTAVPPALDEFFRLTLFNYLVSNGDAHLKNFSLYRLSSGDYHFTPAYDLLNTALHVNDGNGLALDLFADEYETQNFRDNAFLAYPDFLELGHRLGLPLSRVRRLLADMVGHETQVQALIDRSFLPPELKVRYAAVLADRRQRLRYGAPA
ncbi:type II toxin-antitoxin system HipA family toxin [Hymenobacter amundsenii]|uniref:type II toxin-antitoxin system HipA family toxin n=1 Tax=Hymenobacter amundsenii TaxID=2006685 RepID=UPI0013FDE658|nr:HipA domain-containing protein [Hymenobacter amundsenii]